MASVLKNILYIMIGFSAPLWFPIIQKPFNRGFLTLTDWLIVILLLVAPILLLWWFERGEKHERVTELKNAFVEALIEAGLAKGEEHGQQPKSK